MTASTEDKILKLLETLVDGQEQTNKRLDNMDKRLDSQGSEISHVSTALEALAEGQREIRETMATKADILDLGVKINKSDVKTKTRLEHLEEHTGTTNPTKN